MSTYEPVICKLVLTFFVSYTDAIMVDRGFLIDEDCEELGLVLIRPPFLRGKFRFSEQEAQHTNRIASARVYVERAIQRVKKFRILTGTIPTSMLGAVDKILVIISGLVNLQNSIINDERVRETSSSNEYSELE